MARTHGHGNPRWSREETILALDLYNKSGGKALSKEDPRVRALSRFLRALPYDGNSPRNETYRNPDSVAFKLLNLRAVATGKGLKNVSAMDRTVWRELGADAARVAAIAEQVRAGVAATEAIPDGEDEDSSWEFAEGRSLTRLHQVRERSRKVRSRLLSARRKRGPLSCDLCAVRSPSTDPLYEDAVFEAHHVVPIAQSIARKTRLEDVALLCANCHRLIHRIIAREGWLTLETIRTRFARPRPLADHETVDE